MSRLKKQRRNLHRQQHVEQEKRRGILGQATEPKARVAPKAERNQLPLPDLVMAARAITVRIQRICGHLKNRNGYRGKSALYVLEKAVNRRGRLMEKIRGLNSQAWQGLCAELNLETNPTPETL
ncbi:MAG: hypothetical protein HYZ63_01325 [Candidatus Andersenbacteria bacterium]|nr:hypothetical protein [Candidatus Andersenbacteria bacterium]